MCVAATARRVRRQMKLDKRYRAWRRDANTLARRTRQVAEREQMMRQRSSSSKKKAK